MTVSANGITEFVNEMPPVITVVSVWLYTSSATDIDNLD